MCRLQADLQFCLRKQAVRMLLPLLRCPHLEPLDGVRQVWRLALRDDVAPGGGGHLRRQDVCTGYVAGINLLSELSRNGTVLQKALQICGGNTLRSESRCRCAAAGSCCRRSNAMTQGLVCMIILEDSLASDASCQRQSSIAKGSA